MGAYIEFVYILIAAIICCLLSRKGQINLCILFLLLMMLMCGLRGYDVGTDTQEYVNDIKNLDLTDLRHGPIFIALKFIASFFENRATAYLMLIAIFTYIPLIVLIVNKSPFPAISLLLFIISTATFFNETFNIIRQMMAIVYVLWAAVMIDENKYKKAIALTFVSFLIHPYTIIFGLFFFLNKIPLTRMRIMSVLFVTIIIGVGVGSLRIIHTFLDLLSSLTSNSSIALIARFAKYADRDIDANFSLIGQFSHILPSVALCLISVNNKSILNNTFYKMMVWGCCILNLMVSVTYCERIASTYSIAQLLAVPYIILLSKRSRKMMFILLFAMSLLYIYNLNQFSINQQLWTPYHTIFND